jgi:hypothetical protein
LRWNSTELAPTCITPTAPAATFNAFPAKELASPLPSAAFAVNALSGHNRALAGSSASGGVCAGIPQFHLLGASCAANMGKTLRTKAWDNAAAAAQRLVLRASGVLKLNIAKHHLYNALHSS